MPGLNIGLQPLSLNLNDDEGSPPPPKPLYRQPLSPEDYQSFGQKALGAGASGLSYALGTLDKPGQAVRGLLAGKGVSSLKHLIPFSGSLGVTSPEDFTTGRDLTNKAGWTQAGDTGWGAWGAGLATDIATDPLTYMTFGAKHALTPLGAAVRKTGALKPLSREAMLQGFQGSTAAMQAGGRTAEQIAHAVDAGRRIASPAVDAAGAAAGVADVTGKPLGSLARIGVPFGGPGINVGMGQTAQRVARNFDRAGNYLQYGNPLGRTVGSLFDANKQGAVDALTQRGAVNYLTPELQRLQAVARGDRVDLLQRLAPLVEHGAIPEREIVDAARGVGEGVPYHFDPATVAAVQPAADVLNQTGRRWMGSAREGGSPLSDLKQREQYIEHVHRSAFPEPVTELGAAEGRLAPTVSGSNIGRNELFTNVPGGSYRINDWFNRFGGLGRAQAKHVRPQIASDMLNDLVAGGGMVHIPMTEQMSRSFAAKAAAMSRRVVNSNPAYRDAALGGAGRPFFSPDIVADFTQYGNQQAKTQASTYAVTRMLADAAQRATPGYDQVPLSRALRQLGVTTTAFNSTAMTPSQGGLVNLYRYLASKGAGVVDHSITHVPIRELRGKVNQWGVSREALGQINRQYSKWMMPEQLKGTQGLFDSATNAFKSLAYPIWIPSHVRNAVTALTNNARHGVGLRDYMDQLQLMTGRGARDLSGIHPSLGGLAPADQADALRRMQYQHGQIYGGNGLNEEIAGRVSDAFGDAGQARRFTPEVPGTHRAGPTGNLAGDTADIVFRQGLMGSVGSTLSALRDSIGGLGNPTRRWGQGIADNLGIRGVGSATQDVLPAVAAGRKIGTNTEDFMRGALFNRLARQGYTPDAAADVVHQLHFDYGSLTDFEKNVMRRGVPFYTYMRNNIPLQLNTALHQPGIIQAQSKPFNQPREGAYTPKYMDAGFAIPIGDKDENGQQYISKLGLPAEEAFDKFRFQDGVPDVGRTALSFMGGMNPIIKGPLEQLFDTQFHTQRRLSDLQAPRSASAIGRLWNDDNPQLLSQVMANSPLTRFVSSADKLTDSRKSIGQRALNLFTGVRVTNVDVDKQKAIDTREALGELLKQYPHLSNHTEFYVKPEDLAKLSPQEIEALRAYATQQAQTRAWSKSQQRIGIHTP